MRRLLSASLYLCFLAVVGLAQYELTEHSHRLWNWRCPGWESADYAERITVWRPRSGILLMDRLVHEGTEASVYYRGLLFGSPGGPLAPAFQLSQHG